MKKILFILFALCAVPLSTQAQEKDIIITNEWARPILAAGRPGGAYFHVENKGNTADKLIKVSSTISPRVEIHEHTMKDGVMKMSQVEGGLEIPAGGSVELKPGGYHIMIFETATKYQEGDKVELTLYFENAGEITKTLNVMKKR
ncbi:copper chaperone PCu(A)C [Pseudemcibacter aquimaris]|uniref:copper chaperone PCu(A)C n=1 Tax=Pseudemcibacter aquimaris TaxID=2857064 RepID=UPI002011FC0F|nr:copper chaperone PCu(A)C [Pseudemcibacter aquimaris]MCC3861659.1 copper chaperone PCu(A)C [Pseudemcibacter aquimaris]WDU58430.1 copper chaperone PCu(A)C [Pseudemcibacter aquimaris]